MAGSSSVVPVGDEPTRLSSVADDRQSGQSIFFRPRDGSITYGYDDQVAFGDGVRAGTDADADDVKAVSKFLQAGEELWAVADTGQTVNVAVDENGV